MSLELIIYLWGVLDDVRAALLIGAGVTVLALIIASLAEEGWPKLGRSLIITAIALAVSAVMLPSSSTFAAMVVVPKIAQSEAIQKDLPELYSAAVEKLKKELTPSK